MVKLKVTIKERFAGYIKNNAGIFAGGLLALNGNVNAYKAFAMIKSGR